MGEAVETRAPRECDRACQADRDRAGRAEGARIEPEGFHVACVLLRCRDGAERGAGQQEGEGKPATEGGMSESVRPVSSVQMGQKKRGQAGSASQRRRRATGADDYPVEAASKAATARQFEGRGRATGSRARPQPDRVLRRLACPARAACGLVRRQAERAAVERTAAVAARIDGGEPPLRAPRARSRGAPPRARLREMGAERVRSELSNQNGM